MAKGKNQTRKKRRGLEEILQAESNSLRKALRNYRALEEYCGNVRGILVEFLTEGGEPHLGQQPIPGLDLGGYNPIPSVSYVPDITRRVSTLEVMLNRVNQVLTQDQPLTPEQAQHLSLVYGQRAQAGASAGQVDRNRLLQMFKNYRAATEGARDYHLNNIKTRKAQLLQQGLKQDAVDKIYAEDEAWVNNFYNTFVHGMANSINSAFNLGIRP
jgi:hypothetical protein